MSLDDYSGPAGGDGRSSAADLARAVAGVTETPKTPEAVRTAAPNAPKAGI
jgi:hypothetical protein